MSSNAPATVNFSFTGFSARGGRTGEHADGWGIAFHDASGCRLFVDEGSACDSPLAEFLRRHPFKSRSVMAHIRKATQGGVTLTNCHPFQREWLGQHWVFCHNGDLKGFEPSLRGLYQPVGTTDSERAFCWMLQELRDWFPAHPGAPLPGWAELAPALAELSAHIAQHGSFNYLLSNADALYAHCSTELSWLQRRPPFSTVRLVDCDMSLDLSQTNALEDCMAIIATRPLTDEAAWTAFTPGELKVFASGEEVWARTTAPAAARDVDTRIAWAPRWSVPASALQMAV
ncbi:class II glutamine amidotransferase [Caldimonas brevitalea]